MGGRSSSFRKKSGGSVSSESKKTTQQQNVNHSWVQTPPGVDQPTTSTYERFAKRNAREWDQRYREYIAEQERIKAAESPAQKRLGKNFDLEHEAKRWGHVNRFRRKVNKKGGIKDINGNREILPMAPMPSIRYLSREEVNRVKKNVRRKK